MLHHGLYEQVINNQLTSELAEIPEVRKAVAPIDKAEASKVLSQYLADVVQKGLDHVLDNGGDISAQIELANQIVDLIQSTTKEADFAALGVDQRAEQLLALLRDTDPRLAVGKTAADLSRPESSIAQSSLFTGAAHEPQLYAELKKEIASATTVLRRKSACRKPLTESFCVRSSISVSPTLSIWTPSNGVLAATTRASCPESIWPTAVLTIQIGQHKERIRQLDYEVLSDYYQQLTGIEDRLQDEFPVEYQENIGIPRYQQELSRLKRADVVHKNFSNRLEQSIKEHETARRKLFTARKEYIDRFKPCSFRVDTSSFGNTVRLAVFDEAFNKMDSDRIIESVHLLRKMGLQAIICTPPDKVSDIMPIADRTLLVDKRKYKMHILPFGNEMAR